MTARVNGPTIDGRTIRSNDFQGPELTDRAVAAYIAKYATKGAETATGTLDRPIRFLAELAHLRLTDHAERMIRTAWTLGALRNARAAYRRAQSAPDRPEETTYVLGRWAFAGTGLTPAEH